MKRAGDLVFLFCFDGHGSIAAQPGGKDWMRGFLGVHSNSMTLSFCENAYLKKKKNFQ
jgi:hypothetical protein